MNLVGYCRVSTAKQAEDGLSLDEQELRLRAYATATGATMVSVFREVVSGRLDPLRRPEFSAARDLLLDLEEPAALVAVSLDRVSRSLQDVLWLVEDGKQGRYGWVSLKESLDTTTPTGRLVLHVLASFAQFARESSAERVQAALDYRKANQLPYNHPPYGKQWDETKTKWIDHPEEIEVLESIRLHRAAGLTWREVAEALNLLGIRNPRAPRTRWRTTRVHTLAQGPGYRTKHYRAAKARRFA